jgi:DNA (cytosine-5)-methyltransferase 1
VLGKSKCALAAAVKHYCKVDLSKAEQAGDWAAADLTETQIRYAARDAIWLWRLCPPLFAELGPQVSAYRIQVAAAPAIARLNNAGIGFDREKHTDTLRALAEQDDAACAGFRAACLEIGKPDLGVKVPRTDADVAAVLKALLTEDELRGWKRIGKPWQLSTARAELQKAIHHLPIAHLVELSEIKGPRLSFGETLRFLVSPVTGRVHPHYTICGAQPGRSTSSAPNIQGAPRDPRIRSVFRAADGYVLVAADYGAMELRAAAYFFDDPQLAAVFERGDDPHRLTAAHVAGRPLDTITDEERSKAKNVNFGTIYGIGPSSLVAQVWKNYRLIISLDDAEGLLAGFASLYPTMITHRRDYTEACQTRGAIVIGPDWREGRGRIVPLARLPDDQSPTTCAYSYPIQGICSDIAMTALTAVDRRLLADKLDALLVAWIHDELIVEAREADVERVKAILQSEMERAFVNTFPTATLRDLIEVKVASNWAAIKEKPKAPASPPILKVGPLRALDLFCCSGGASRGFMDAGFHVTGVDINPQPRYVGDHFIQAEVLSLDVAFLQGFDLIHSSPPCQALSSMRHVHNALPHLNLIPATRALLKASGRPYIIENVEGAREHLVNPILLCGTMFDLGAEGRELQRHRLFETSFPITAPACQHSGRPVLGVYGGHVRDRRRPHGLNHVSGSNLPITVGREAMHMPWASGQELSEAIPPAFAEYIARQFLRVQGRQEQEPCA